MNGPILCYLKLVFISLVITATSCQQDTQHTADLIITNANIWTGDPDHPTASAIAIAADTIVAVGDFGTMSPHKGPHTIMKDAQGKMITPGFIDSHVHLLAGGRSLLSVELRDANTPEEFIRRIADFAKTIKPGEWILEGNWDHTLWGGELPRKEWIDKYTPENPVVIYRLDGHMVLANSLALKHAGIDKQTADVESGLIVRNPDGSPTGILKSRAMDVMLNMIPPMTEDQQDESFRAAMKYFVSNGVTSVHDVDSLACARSAIKALANDEVQVRIYGISPLYYVDQYIPGNYDPKWYKTGGLKGFVDGSLGSHTAAFHHAYSDVSDGDAGFFVHDENELFEWINKADQKNLQVMIHAIGDKAIHTILNIYERIVQQNGEKDRRLRIEHAQHIDPKDISKFAQLGVIASMQPYHAIDDGRWAEEAIGSERIKTTYAFKSLLDAQTKIAFGSDWAVAPASPLLGIYSATTRRTLDHKNPDGWVPEQKISVKQALIAYTRDAAYASFEETLKGSLTIGKLADFVILSEDIMKIDLHKIKDVHIVETYVGGKQVFDYQY